MTRFPDNYNGARKRLTNIENKMDRDPAFAAAYTAQIEKLIENGYARRLENRAQVRDCFFLHISPLQIRTSLTRFESCSTRPPVSRKSLNDYLLSGPDLLNSLTGILFRFRIGSVAFTGDIRTCFCEYVSALPINERSYFCGEVPIATEPRVYAMTSLILARRHRRRPRSTYSTKCGNMFR
ncbi:hypothetical protein EVAR_68024_1 [Eumeta japonica]|uniref:Uncharacterized protein n=1 Tax=Eumeta variegata TaxID=151549 RepID=A0A4C1SXN8_EUMVA|nr:hypothetical protein EVAR_68024_1 [Eumeta japonica]